MEIIENIRNTFESTKVLEKKLKIISGEIEDLQSLIQKLGVEFVNLHQLPLRIEKLQENKNRLQNMINKRKSRK